MDTELEVEFGELEVEFGVPVSRRKRMPSIKRKEIEEASKENMLMLTAESGLPMELRLSTMLHTFIKYLARRKDYSYLPGYFPYTVNRPLSDSFDTQAEANPEATAGVLSKDVTVNQKTGTWVRIFFTLPESKGSRPLVVFYHGGAFAFGTPASFAYHTLCTNLAEKAACVVVSVHYRRSPECKYPIAHDDSFEVLKWLQSTTQLPEFADLSRCILMGDSSGGNLVHFTGCRAAQEDLKPIAIRGHVLIQPHFGGEERTPPELGLKHVPILSLECSDWCWKAYLGPDKDRDHPVCNVFGPRSHGVPTFPLPPSLVIVGDHDILQDWQRRYVHDLQKAGHYVEMKIYKGAIHAFYLYFQFHLADTVLSDICFFIKKNA